MDNVIKQLKELSSIKPRQDWVEQNKAQLMSQITAQTVQKQKSIFGYWYLIKMLIPFRVLNFAAKPIGIVSLALLVLVSSGVLTVNASKGTIPGDSLYPIKLTSERVQVSFTVTDEKKSQVHIEHAQERANEIEKVVNEEQDPIAKKEKIKVASDNLKKDINGANESLEKVKANKQEKGKAQKTIEVIMEVDAKTKELSTKLKEQKIQVALDQDKDSVKELASAVCAVEVMSVKTTEVIVEKYDSGDAQIDPTQVVKAVEEKMKNAGDKLQEITDKEKLIEEQKVEAGTVEEEVAVVATPEVTVQVDNEVVVEELEDGSTEEEVGSEEVAVAVEEVVVPEVPKTSVDAQKLLIEAQDLLSQGDMKQALQKINQVNEISTQVEIDIEDKLITPMPVINDKEQVTTDSAVSESGEVVLPELTPEELLAQEALEEVQ